MMDCTLLLPSFTRDSWTNCVHAAILGLLIFSGCDHVPEAAKRPWPESDHESAKPVDFAAEPLESENDILLSGQSVKFETTKPRSEEDPVTARLKVLQEEWRIGGTFELTVVLTPDPGYEIYSLDASPPKIPTQLELKLPSGFTPLEEWRSPAPVQSFNSGGGSVYLGETRFVHRVKIATDAKPGDYSLGCSVSYQACNSRQCLRPVETLLSVKMSVLR